MRATVQFIRPDKKLGVLKKMLDIVQGLSSLWQHLLAHGILLEKLSPSDIGGVKTTLARMNFSSYTATGSSLHLVLAENRLRNLFRLVVPVPGRSNDFAILFWERGFTLADIGLHQARSLKQRLVPIATVSIGPDVQQPHIYTVSGQVWKIDGTPLSTIGFTIHIFDERAIDGIAEWGKPAVLHANGTFQVDHAWQSDHRKNPDLLIRVLDPQGRVVAEEKKSAAAIHEFVEIVVEDSAVRTYTLTGMLKNEATGRPLPDLQVEALFQAENQEISRTGKTNGHGIVFIPFDESFFSIGKNVQVTFRVEQNNRIINANTVLSGLTSGDREVEIFVAMAAPAGSACHVRGTIRHVNGFPVSGGIVRAFDRDMRAESLLGQTRSDGNGCYEITYSTGQFRRLGKAQADLVVRVYEVDGDYGDRELKPGKEVAVSSVVFDAPTQLSIDLVVASPEFRGPSEYERHLAQLEPLIESVKLHALTDEDLHFLNGKTGIPFEQLNFLRLDARWACEHRFVPAVSYGFFRQGLAANLRRLMTEKRSRLQKALDTSMAQNIVPSMLASQADRLIDQFLSADQPERPDSDSNSRRS